MSAITGHLPVTKYHVLTTAPIPVPSDPLSFSTLLRCHECGEAAVPVVHPLCVRLLNRCC